MIRIEITTVVNNEFIFVGRLPAVPRQGEVITIPGYDIKYIVNTVEWVLIAQESFVRISVMRL